MKKRDIKIMHFLIAFIVVILTLLSCQNNSFASDRQEKITLTSRIKNVSNGVKNTYTYIIEPEQENPEQTEAKTIALEFDNVIPNSNNEAIVNYDLDFLDVEFKRLGIYKYIVSEIASSDEMNYPISNDKYEIYVVVEKNNEGQIEKNIYAQALDLNSKQKSKLEFSHEHNYTSISIENYVTGKYSSTNEYFKFKLRIMGNVGDVFEIIGQDEEVIYGGKRIRTQKYYTVQEGEENYVYIYLKANQKATIGVSSDNINQIPIGTEYYLAKIDAKIWNTTINDENIVETKYLATQKNSEINKIIIVNKRRVDLPITGIFINILPFVILIAIAIIGIILMIKMKKDDDDDGDEDNK